MKLLIPAIILIFSFGAKAQVVNIEKKRFSQNGKKLQGDIDLAVNFIKSTTDIVQAKNAVKLQYYKDKTTYLFFNDISIMQVDTQSFLNDGFMHLRYNYTFSKSWLIAEAFTQIQYNKIQKIQRRFLWGGGLRYQIVDTANVSFYAGTSLMYEFELLLDQNYTDLIRINTYLSARFKIKDNVSFGHITYYQPATGNLDDYRISSETNIKFKITKQLLYKTSLRLTYDSSPPSDIQNLFYTLNNGITYIF